MRQLLRRAQKGRWDGKEQCPSWPAVDAQRELGQLGREARLQQELAGQSAGTGERTSPAGRDTVLSAGRHSVGKPQEAGEASLRLPWQKGCPSDLAPGQHPTGQASRL